MKKLLTISSILIGGILLAQKTEPEITVDKSENKVSIMPVLDNRHVTVAEMQKAFIYKKYSVEILKQLVKNSLKNGEENATVFESIPGEIIGWTSTDGGAQTQTVNFQLKNGKLIEVNTTIGETELKKLNKFAPKNSHFELNNDYLDAFKYPSVGNIDKKLKTGEFNLSSQITLQNDNGNKELYDLEYQTKDFKKFLLKRFKESESNKWINIK